jgi:putative transposase
VRPLKGRLLWLEPFATVEALRLAVLAFKGRSNTEWLIERHGHRSPASVSAAVSPAGAPPPAPELAA